MKVKRHKLRGDEGFTFIETILTIVIMAIMVLGLSIVMMAFKDHLDRSWAIRTMDQYGNDVVEMLTHELRNAVDVTVIPDTKDTDRISVKVRDPWNPDIEPTHFWYADLRTGQIKRNHKLIDLDYPPTRLRRGESFQINEFRLKPFGQGTFDPLEATDALRRNVRFRSATYNIELTLTYNRGTVHPGDRAWFFQKSYKNRVYMRNKNLAIGD